MIPRRIDADDPAVRRRSYAALVDTHRREAPEVTIRCRTCGAALAYLGHTAHGPLFVSTWSTPPARTGYVVGGRNLFPRELERWLSSSGWATEQYDHGIDEGRDGTWILMALPADMSQDYPDLFIRCPKDGDTVLDRHEALDWLRAGKRAQKIQMDGSRLAYRPAREPEHPVGPATLVRRRTVSRRLRWNSTA